MGKQLSSVRRCFDRLTKRRRKAPVRERPEKREWGVRAVRAGEEVLVDDQGSLDEFWLQTGFIWTIWFGVPGG